MDSLKRVFGVGGGGDREEAGGGGGGGAEESKLQVRPMLFPS